MRRCSLLVVLVTFGLSLPLPFLSAQSLIQTELRIPWAKAGSKGLAAVMIRPNEPGPHPLAVITHGRPRTSDDFPGMTPFSFLSQAREFARRGWTAVVIMRRGYGDSGGSNAEYSGQCSHPSYKDVALNGAADLRAAVEYLSKLAEVDPSRMIVVGRSVGGLTTIALSAEPPAGVVAAINFAGGSGSIGPDDVCSPEVLVQAFGFFGKRSKIPMLWVYSENDRYFSPQLARRFHQAFADGGGRATLTIAPEFDVDGHNLFSRKGIPLWTPIVDEFLKGQNLSLRTTLLPLELPQIEPPEHLSARGKEEFREYLASAPHKAFAVSAKGHYGYSSERRTEKNASERAISACQGFVGNSAPCKLIMVNDRQID
jgi:dienelactone hydrolase